MASHSVSSTLACIPFDYRGGFTLSHELQLSCISVGKVTCRTLSSDRVLQVGSFYNCHASTWAGLGPSKDEMVTCVAV